MERFLVDTSIYICSYALRGMVLTTAIFFDHFEGSDQRRII